MGCIGGKNPFFKLNCILVNNLPSVQVTSPYVLDRVSGENQATDEIVSEEGKEHKSQQSCAFFPEEWQKKINCNFPRKKLIE